VSLAQPQTRDEWRLHWDAIGFAWQEDAPLRERQAAAAFQREHFRCGGCSGPATRRVPDFDAETGEELCPVPLCDTCTPDDATPREADWSDEHKAARVPPLLPEWGAPFSRARETVAAPVAKSGPPDVFFSFTIPRDRWLRGQGEADWLLEDTAGRLCAVAHFLRASDAKRPETSYRVNTPQLLKSTYEFCTGLHFLSEINERQDIDDETRERELWVGFRSIGVAIEFVGGTP